MSDAANEIEWRRRYAEVCEERDTAIAELERLERRGQLLSAVLHCVRNDDNGSYLVGLELPDTEFRDADQKRAKAYVRGHLRQMEGLFIEAWNRWREQAQGAE